MLHKEEPEFLSSDSTFKMAGYQPPTADAVAHIKHCYHVYRHTADIGRKGLFFSPTCMQICRPTPSYAATSRDGIVQYLRDAQQGKIPVDTPVSTSAGISDLSDGHTMEPEPTKPTKSKSVYTIRALAPSEFEFGSDDIVAPIRLTTVQLKSKAVQEKWIGMRVNLWEEGVEQGLLVKVQYWWRLEEILGHKRIRGELPGTGWRQCLHDIIFLGPKNGTENEDGLDVLE